MNEIHDQVHKQIQKSSQKYKKNANEKRTESFVLAYLRKERFPKRTYNKVIVCI